MNPSDTNRIQAFIDKEVLPAFVNLKTELETLEKPITIIRNTENITEAASAAVRQMHPETPYFASKPSASSSSQSWIVASLYVEILQQPATDSIYIGQYCLSIEIKTTPSAQIQISSIVGYAQATDKLLKTQRNRLEKDHQHLNIEETYDSDITLHFIESFDAFENYCLKAESPSTTPEQTSNLYQSSLSPSESKLEQSPLSRTSPPAPISESPIPQSTLQPSTSAEIAAARAKLRIVQHQETETLLNYLKLSKTSFRHLWEPDFERGATLAQKIVNHHPDQNSDYQQAYDLLAQQATEFAWSLKPKNRNYSALEYRDSRFTHKHAF